MWNRYNGDLQGSQKPPRRCFFTRVYIIYRYRSLRLYDVLSPISASFPDYQIWMDKGIEELRNLGIEELGDLGPSGISLGEPYAAG